MHYETESIYALYICNVVWCKGILALKRKNLNKPLVVTSSVIMSVKISVCTSLSSCSSSSSLSSSPTFSSVFLMLSNLYVCRTLPQVCQPPNGAVLCHTGRIGSKHHTDKETAYIFHVYHHYLFVHYVPSLTLYNHKQSPTKVD